VLETAPPDAVSARVTVRLAPGSTPTAVGVVPGTSVIVDDVSLQRPQVSLSIKTNRSIAYRGKTAYLSGSVMPASTVGATATVYIKRPGAGWTKLTTAPISAFGGSAVWRAKYTFGGGARKGLYRFKTTVPAIPGYLGATSSTAYVRLK